MPLIRKIHAREVFDSRGRPTVEVDVACDGGFGRAIVPSGASTGSHEAHELRDADMGRYQGLGVTTAVNNVNTEISDFIVGMDAAEQDEIDQGLINLDGTSNKVRLGANAILGVSLAVAHAAAAAAHQPLYQYLNDDATMTIPVPMVNIISGGLHANRNLDFQDYLVMPVGAASFHQAMEWVSSIRDKTMIHLQQSGFSTLLADEGGFGPLLKSNEQSLDIICSAIDESGLIPGDDVYLAIDVAAQHFYTDRQYQIAAEKRALDSKQMVEWLSTMSTRYPILSIEDGLAEDDWEGWSLLTNEIGKTVQVLGDDLFTTNPDRIQHGIDQGASNAALIKVNQIGTLSEALQALKLAKTANLLTVVSARSGESEDSTIADIAVASGSGQIKIGSIARSERGAKYNQLLRIEEELGAHAVYAGATEFDRFTTPSS